MHGRAGLTQLPPLSNQPKQAIRGRGTTVRIEQAMTRKSLWLATVLLCGTVPCVAQASPWAEVGDNQLRGDVELLAVSGVIGETTTHWPIPWTSITQDIRANGALEKQSDLVGGTAARVMGEAREQTEGGFNGSFFLDATNQPSTVYGFDGMGRGKSQTQLSLGFNSGNFSGRLSAGIITDDFKKQDTKLMLDGSYLAAKVWGALVYAGEISHWWGPGWISALSVSDNARPMPQIGIERLSDTAFTWPVLRWLGPWQSEFFIGYLDDKRLQSHQYYDALHVTFNPAPGLEVGFQRTQQLCGQGHVCSPLRDYFSFNNDPAHPNDTNDQFDIDLKYSRVIDGLPAQVYMQLMDEDTEPFGQSATSHLYGASVFVPVRSGSPVRLTAEFTDTVPTRYLFSYGDYLYGYAYTNGDFVDGMRYRGRTLGFSLDSDSQLFSLEGSWSDNGGRFYELSFHHASISDSHVALGGYLARNIVTTSPVKVNMGEARVTLPWRAFKLDLSARMQDDQPRPAKGFAAAFEMALRTSF